MKRTVRAANVRSFSGTGTLTVYSSTRRRVRVAVA